MKPSPADLNQTLASILQAAAGLPRITLYPEERMRMAGSAFYEAPLLVTAVSRAVEEAPDLFADLEVDPADLRQTQDRAGVYARLHDSLARLAVHAHDLYLYEQSRATAGAMDVVRDGRRRLEGPGKAGEGRRLDAALRTPEAILNARTENARRPVRKGRRPARRRRFTAREFVARLRAR